MDKIRYRLVYNRKKTLNGQGCALVQIEAKLNQRNIYMTTNVYLKPEHWDSSTAQIVNHPQANELNALLFEKIIHLQSIELSLWKRGIQPTLSLLKDSIKKKIPVQVSFITFARSSIRNSDKKPKTKENLLTTLTVLEQFRQGVDFADLTYSFLKDFEVFLRERGSSVNTIAKHLRQLRTLINEAINEGYMSQDAYPFRKFKIKQEKGKHEFLTPNELKKMENLQVDTPKDKQVLDAFLFCCYTGLRFSDFRALKSDNIVRVYRKRWLFLTMIKTEEEIKLPLELLFEGKALPVLDSYPSVEAFADIPNNAETNKMIAALAVKCGIKKKITFHTSRHTCATLLVHKGTPITTVQKILGHTSIKTTQIYSEVLSDTIVRDLRHISKKRA